MKRIYFFFFFARGTTLFIFSFRAPDLVTLTYITNFYTSLQAHCNLETLERRALPTPISALNLDLDLERDSSSFPGKWYR